MSKFLVAISGWGSNAGAEVVGGVVFALSIVLMILSVSLVVAVLMQSSKDHKLSGAIAGGADTFFGKTKGNDMDKLFSKLTIIGSILFVVIVVALYVLINWHTLA
ncbi:MAG: preprotein translocase subunit SecG [Clostridia bacterium]|nr:preprotein translocase subunit SecG [Clostridia bacterium]